MQLEQLGPYRIGALIGRGGMGEVYDARHVETGQRAAVKVLSPAMARSEGFRDRFEAEIESLRKLHHPNIVEMYGYGEHEGLLFYAMERVDGRSLDDELCNQRRFTWREVTSIAIQLCKALKHAHDHGIVHRDLKPANILLTADDQVKLLDFGIARLFGGNQLTSAGGVLGTADYMSPEQADGRPVTDRCDQYSLGCVLYALATGSPPFHSESLPKLLQMQRFSKPEPLRRHAPDTPEQLERIVLQLLEKEPEKRYPNAQVLARHLTAMERALTRPVEPDDFHLSDADHAIATAQTGVALEATRIPDDDAPLELAGPAATQDLSIAARTIRPATAQASTKTPPTTIPPLATGSHFTSVAEEIERQRQEQAGEAWTHSLVQFALLGAALAALLAAGWYLLKPATADQLYAQIEAAEEASPENMRSVEREIGQFLERFPDDPRRARIEEHAAQLELKRAERRLRLFVNHAGPGADLAPLERTYVEAMRRAEEDPAQALVELNALLALYAGAPDLSEEQRQCLALARRQADRLKSEIDSTAETQRAALQERLDYAELVRESDPAAAARIWRAVLDLYAHKPWAAAEVAQARAGLEAAQ